MNIRYVGHNVEWTEEMKRLVSDKIVQPVSQALGHENFELAVFLEPENWCNLRKALWIVLQRLDGRHNQVIRQIGDDFEVLATHVAEGMVKKIQKSSQSKCALFNLRKFHQIA